MGRGVFLGKTSEVHSHLLVEKHSQPSSTDARDTYLTKCGTSWLACDRLVSWQALLPLRRLVGTPMSCYRLLFGSVWTFRVHGGLPLLLSASTILRSTSFYSMEHICGKGGRQSEA
jgi:hypothetical protein